MARIIIGIDDKDHSRDAIAFGRMLASSAGARITLAHAYPWEPAEDIQGSYRFDEYLRSEARELLDRAAGELRDLPDLKLVALADRSPARALQDVAAEESAGLIVVGSSHPGRPGRVLPGGTAERLLHGAPCPVAVVPAGYAAAPRELRAIVASWDGSPQADAGLAAAEELTRAVSGVLQVVRVHAPAYTTPYPVGLGLNWESQVATLRERAREVLDERISRLDAEVRPEGVLLEGDPVDAIVGITDTADLLVMGSRGYGPLHAVLLGGVSGRVIRSAACPVIVVPYHADKALGSVFVARSEQPA